MGKYNGAVVTTAGEGVIAQAITGTELTWTVMRTSSVAVAAVDVKALTALTGIEQTAGITDASVYDSNVIQVSARFSNTGIATPYYIRTVGIYGKLAGGSETLIAVMTAITPDEMPVYDADAPSAFIFTDHLTVQDAESVTMSVNDTGTATVADLNRKLDKSGGDLSDTVAATATASSAEYPIPAAGDSFKVILGKIRKFFADIKSAVVGLSISGKTITYTKADGTTGTLTTQDTTYGVVSKTANGLAPKLPNETSTTKYLRQDGTWQYLPLKNNATTTTEEHYALDARMGKTLQDRIDSANTAIETKATSVNSGTYGKAIDNIIYDTDRQQVGVYNGGQWIYMPQSKETGNAVAIINIVFDISTNKLAFRTSSGWKYISID